MTTFWIPRRGLGRLSESTRILLYLALWMIAGCAVESKPIYQFLTDADFNITTKLGFEAPKCSRLCYPFPAELFVQKEVPCAEYEGDIEKWVPCLCTHRPLLRYLVDCIYHKCGPAIPSAFEFGYHICADYNITFPPPREAVVDLNVTPINDAIDVPETIPKMPLPFSDELPPPKEGGSASDENPPLNLNLSMQSTASRDKSIFFSTKWEDKKLRIIAVWTAAVIGLSGGFVGLL